MKKILCGILLLLNASGIFSQADDTKIDSLLNNLLDKNKPDTVRLKSAEELGCSKNSDSTIIKSLIGCFSDANPFLRGKSASSIAQIGKPTVPFLINALKSEIENVKWSAAVALGKIGKDAFEAAPFLARALDDKNENVRWCSLIALGNIGPAASEYSSQISKFLYNEDSGIKWAAVYALKKISPQKISDLPDFNFVKQTADSLIPVLMKKYKIPGVSVCFVQDRKVTWSKNYGVKDVRTNEPVTDETMFEACSMTKPVFAYTVLKLVEEGKLNLDRPLSDYLDEKFTSLYDYENKITARMILCHTSGLPNWRKGDEETGGPLPLYFEPGSKFGYSGEGYYYLQRVVEKMIGESIAEYANRTLFEPLELKHAGYVWTEEFDPFISAGHDTSGSFLRKTQYTHANAAYTLYVSARDYAAFICRILDKDNPPFSENLLKGMVSHQVEVNVREPIDRPGSVLGLQVYWGLGWAIDSTVSGDIVYHSGANSSGFRCYSQFNYHRGTAIVIMTNGLNGSEFWRSIISEIGDF